MIRLTLRFCAVFFCIEIIHLGWFPFNNGQKSLWLLLGRPKRTALQSCVQVNTLDAMYTVKRLPEFTEWMGSMKDAVTRIRLNKRLDKVQRGLLGDSDAGRR